MIDHINIDVRSESARSLDIQSGVLRLKVVVAVDGQIVGHQQVFHSDDLISFYDQIFDRIKEDLLKLLLEHKKPGITFTPEPDSVSKKEIDELLKKKGEDGYLVNVKTKTLTSDGLPPLLSIERPTKEVDKETLSMMLDPVIMSQPINKEPHYKPPLRIVKTSESTASFGSVKSEQAVVIKNKVSCPDRKKAKTKDGDEVFGWS